MSQRVWSRNFQSCDIPEATADEVRMRQLCRVLCLVGASEVAKSWVLRTAAAASCYRTTGPEFPENDSNARRCQLRMRCLGRGLADGEGPQAAMRQERSLTRSLAPRTNEAQRSFRTVYLYFDSPRQLQPELRVRLVSVLEEGGPGRIGLERSSMTH